MGSSFGLEKLNVHVLGRQSRENSSIPVLNQTNKITRKYFINKSQSVANKNKEWIYFRHMKISSFNKEAKKKLLKYCQAVSLDLLFKYILVL